MENRQNKPPKGGAASGHGGQKFHTDSEQAKLHKSKLRMESREERLNKARERLAKQKPPKKPGPIKRIARIAGHETHAFLHGKVYQEERDNVGVEGGHFVERSGEAALHYGRHKVRRAIREHPAKAAARAESRYIKATADYHSRKFAQEQPEAQSAAARLWHRHKLKREYQRKARETAKQTAKAAEQTVSATERFVREAAAFVKRHPVGTLLALGCLLVVLTLQSCMSSMVSVGNSTLAAIAASTYKAEDADMLGAEAAYCALEDELQRYLDTYTRTHDYDEYHFDLDTIEHDPYVWGGSSPSTSFDCSGFVSYVYNQCGWSFGRLGAQGLYNICSRTSSPRPGDLVFFVGTYDTAGISHVGIYVGNGWMLHCGDPISYANLNSSYWQSHLYAYGRLP